MLSTLKRMPGCVMLVLGMITISGCTASNNFYSRSAATHSVPDSQGAFSSELNAYLSSAAAGSTLALAHSPWGSNVLLQAEPPYFAASGRTCRELTVSTAVGGMQNSIVCQSGQGSWDTVRPVTQLLGR